MRVGPTHDGFRAVLVAVFEHDTTRLAVGHEDLVDGAARLDLDPQRLRGPRDRHRNPAGAALLQTPRPKCTVDLAHVVVQQHIGGTG